MSMIVKSGADGAVTVPAELCRAAGLAPGTDLVAEVETGRIILETPRVPIWSGYWPSPPTRPRRTR